jgi:hypothetical protein
MIRSRKQISKTFFFLRMSVCTMYFKITTNYYMRYFFTSLILLSICVTSLAQKKIEQTQLFSGNFASEKKDKGVYVDAIKINNDAVLLYQEAELYLKTYILFAWTQPVYPRLYIEHIDLTTNKMKRINFPPEFNDMLLKYQKKVVGKDGTVRFFMSADNEKRKSKVVFSFLFDPRTDKIKASKIFETVKKEKGSATSMSLELVTNQNDDRVAIVSMISNRKDCKFEYVVKNYNMEVLSQGENITVRGVNANDVYDYTLGEDNSLVLLSVQVVKNGKLFSAITYNSNIHILGNGKAVVIPVVQSKFVKRLTLRRNLNGVPMLVYLYSDTRNKIEGMCISTIDAANGKLSAEHKIAFDQLQTTIADEDLDNVSERRKERIRTREDRRDKRDAVSSNNTITNLTFAPNGDMYVQIEKFYITQSTTTTTTGSGASRTTSTRTTTYYNYGPGVIHCIDPQTAELKGHLKLDYRYTYSSYDPGKGIDVVPSSNKKVWLRQGNDFCEYNVDNSKKSLYYSSSSVGRAASQNLLALRLGKTPATGNIFTNKDQALLIKHTKKSIVLSEIPLQ